MEYVVNVKEKANMKKKMADILLDISWANLSNKYFGKSRSWLYHKLDGINGNGGEDDFNDEEKELLRSALVDLSERIRTVAEKI